MTERTASRTALLVAAYRARASKADGALFHDPWAEGLAGEDGAALATRVDRHIEQRELWVAVRTAYIDGKVRGWTARHAVPEAGPATQVVILGAGFDTRAARLARPNVRFFEVDHPASQREKRTRLEGLDGYPLAAATFVGCDFEHDDFVDRLVAAGFDAASPAFVLWEGVTPYLHEPAVRATLRRVATGCHPRSTLLFDHFTKSFVEGAARSQTDQHARTIVEDLGERFVFGTNDVLPMLYEEGFRHVRSVSFDEACLTLTGTYDRKREFRFQHLVTASVTAPPTR